MARILITSALPYINGVKHLGNLAGSMLPADVYARFMRLQGHDVLAICATDEHGTPAELAAAAAGQDVRAYCDEQHEIQKSIGEQFGLSWDYFGRTSSPQNAELTQHFAETLEKVIIDTVESGHMTKDLALLVGPDQGWLTTMGFLEKIDENLNKALVG